MSSSMFERLCAAYWDARHDSYPGGWKCAAASGSDVVEAHRRGVAALLREMREPAVFSAIDRGSYIGIVQAKENWEHAIDAILAEAPEDVRGDE